MINAARKFYLLAFQHMLLAATAVLDLEFALDLL